MIPRCRPQHLGLIDLLFLVLALVVAVIVARLEARTIEEQLGLAQTTAAGHPSLKEYRATEGKRLRTGPWSDRIKWFLREVLSVGTPVLVLLTPGICLATYRSSAMFRQRSRRGVGVLTTAITGTMVVVYLSNEYVLRRFFGSGAGFGHNRLEGIWREIADQVSVATLAFWLVLAVGRRWRAEPHWRDRLGRGLGAAWLCYWFVDGVLSPLWLNW